MSFNKAVERKAKLELEIEQMQKQILLIKNQVSNEKRKMQTRTKIVLGAELLKMSKNDDEVKNFVRLLAEKFSNSERSVYDFMIDEHPHLELKKITQEEEKVQKIETPKQKKKGSLRKSTS